LSFVVPSFLLHGRLRVQGKRPYMEDRHTVVGTLNGDPSSSFYGVFDGHGGDGASEYLSFSIFLLIMSLVGDSRAVLIKKSGDAVPLSSDHKVPSRVSAIGDRMLKPYVIAEPELIETQRTEDDLCLVLASDGVW
ncbi:hypothetical protein DYB38_006806, partial [Aphanomyces astaci]